MRVGEVGKVGQRWGGEVWKIRRGELKENYKRGVQENEERGSRVSEV